MNISDIFTLENYDQAYTYISTHINTTIEDLHNGTYKIIQLPTITPEEFEQLKKEKIAKLHLTSADVERAILKAMGIDFEDIIEMVKKQNPEQVKALKVELKANYFYRGNSYVDKIGKLLGLTSEQLDKFFESNNYKCLISN